jgi:trk system potassium uptake protein TrkH
MWTEKGPFRDILFETVSAFGTVGLSTGITPTLSTAGKALVSLMMFCGRVGPLTLAYAFTTYRSPAGYTYPQERVMVG